MRAALFFYLVLFSFLLLPAFSLQAQQEADLIRETDSHKKVLKHENAVVTDEESFSKEKPGRGGFDDPPYPNAVPTTMNYQGLLEEGGGPASGTKSMTFGLYENESGGSALWSETQSVDVGEDGLFSVKLGAESENEIMALQCVCRRKRKHAHPHTGEENGPNSCGSSSR
jgi:hypothetical protein